MKFGIKKKLIIAFIMVIVIPIISLSFLFKYTKGTVEQSEIVMKSDIERRLEEEIVFKIKNNYKKLKEYDDFNILLRENIEKNHFHIQVTNPEYKVIFDSKSKGNVGKILRSYSNEFSSIGVQFDSIHKLEVSDGERLIWYVVFLNSNLQGKSMEVVFNWLYKILLISLAIVIMLIIIFTILISRGILKPLKELKLAAHNISEGNLDFKITYNKNDELGQFCSTFNMMTKKLKESLYKQEEEERKKKELVASISHDLRTPITSIKGYVEGLEDGICEDEDMFHRYLSVIKEKTNTLDVLIDDLFNFSQLDLGKLKMNLQKYDSRELLSNIFMSKEIEFKNKSIKLIIDKPLSSIKINVDKVRIYQVIDNLITNAERAVASDGHIQVGSKIIDNYLSVYIKDNGRGICDKDLPNIFDKFYRGEKSRCREYGGAGLGLAICKYIIEAHEGEIWVDSVINKGSTFYFKIPIVQ